MSAQAPTNGHSDAGDASTSTSTAAGWPTSSWLRSIDAVYDLFEAPELRARYPRLSELVRDGVTLCEQAVREIGLEHCALSFNGGKDCTVLVHMLAAVLRRLHGHTQPPHDASSASSSNSTLSSAPLPPPSTSDPLIPIPSIYITCPSPFPTLESFVRSSIRRYNLELYTVRGPMKPALIEYFHGGGVEGVPELGSEAREREEADDGRAEEEGVKAGAVGEDVIAARKRPVKAVFIGTRRTDPGGTSLGPRTPTDPGWPQVERVHPILDWSYHDVWDFLRCPELGDPELAGSSASGTPPSSITNGSKAGNALNGGAGDVAQGAALGEAERRDRHVPYCLLYDQGYTSLGSTFNTIPNPVLKIHAHQEPSDEAVDASPTPSTAEAAAGTSQPRPSAGPYSFAPSATVGDGTATGWWKPAYMLPDGSSERAGRLKRTAAQATSAA